MNIRVLLTGVCLLIASEHPVAQDLYWRNFAGTPGEPGSADGTGSAARFSSPAGMVVDAGGNLFVASIRLPVTNRP